MSDARRMIERRQRELAASVQARFDDFTRSPEAEEQINGPVRSALTSPAGRKVMDYLMSITTNLALPPSATDAELRSMEGMRRLVAILDKRRKSAPLSKGTEQ